MRHRRPLRYECPTCRGLFAEATVEAILKRAAANSHGGAVTPEIERALAGF